MEQNLSKKTRTESDLIGSREVPESALYGVQTLRGIENFRISKFHLNEYPLFIQALAITKMGAAVANRELDLLTEEQADAILKACKEILEGKHHDQFPVDMIQGGRGYYYEYERQRSDCQPCVGINGTSARGVSILFAQRSCEPFAVYQ